MFGGANLKAYCRTTLWNFHLPKVLATKNAAPVQLIVPKYNDELSELLKKSGFEDNKPMLSLAHK